MARPPFDVLIVGSGFAGIGLGIKLRKKKVTNFAILERAASLGGVWRDNTYPGVACDVPAHLYSYSFEPNPHWSRLFAPQSEILSYLQRCAEKYQVVPHIRFGANVVGAHFDPSACLWTVTTQAGEQHQARILVSASGHALTVPVVPKFPGIESFRGKVFHSSRWRHDVDLSNQRVAVVGTGASAIQIVPNIVERVSQLTLFQRTAPWVLPRRDRRLSAQAQNRFARRPLLQKAMRGAIYSVMESFAVGFVVDPRVNLLREKVAIRHLEKQVHDAELRAKLTPQIRLGCKRILYSDEYYPALAQSKSQVETAPIARFVPEGIVSQSGTLTPADVVVFATGFEAAEVDPPFALVGHRDGAALDIRDAWADGIEAYLGTTISGFPNFFMLLGPNSGLGHSSMIYMMESQFSYIMDAVATMAERGLRRVEVTAVAQRNFNDGIQGRLKQTVWQAGCNSWYLRKDGKNTTLWPGFTFEFRNRTKRFDVENYLTQ